MGYGAKIYEEAMAELNRRREEAEGRAAIQRETLYSRCPEAALLKEQMAANAAGAARAVMGGGDVRAELTRLKDRAMELDRQYEALLEQAGVSRAALEPNYSCRACRDTGYVDGRMCACLKNLQRALAYRQLSLSVPLEKCGFDQFSLDYYRDDPRAAHQMENILKACRTYAANFRANSPSLLFKGGTGLGKTHLSLAIAGAAIEKGYGVIYGSAQSFALSLERERFDRRDTDREEGGAYERLLACDLLILDDLGTEFPSAYVNAALYDILNTRLLAEKPTIISTNLTMQELEQRYSQRFASRIAGSYGTLEFLGRDVRVQQRRKRREQA